MAERQEVGIPPIPAETVREGSRWRFHAPTSSQVAEWFESVPLDEVFEGAHSRFVGGVVIIPQGAKQKYQTERGINERHEMTYTPYMQIGTRLSYARQLAEKKDLVLRIAPLQVERFADNQASAYFNANLEDGLWWHVVVNAEGQTMRYLCSTQVVQFFEKEEYYKAKRDENHQIIWGSILPLLEGRGTKQVSGGADPNALMKAQTGAIGRALGTAGILVLGTGIASAEDMQEFTGSGDPQAAAAPELPVTQAPREVPAGKPPELSTDPAEMRAALLSRATAAEARLQELGANGNWDAWWRERRGVEGWKTLGDVPIEALDPIVGRLESAVRNAEPVRNAAPEIDDPGVQ